MSEVAQTVDNPASTEDSASHYRMLAEKSHAKRRENARLRAIANQNGREAQYSQPQAQIAQSSAFLQARVAQVEGEIERQHGLLSKAKDPKDVKDLAMAIDRLYQTWSLLTGHERPGVRKAKRAGREPSPAIAVLPKEIDTP